MNRLNQIGRLGKLSSYKPGGSWSSYWAAMVSATVENAAPTDVVLTFTSVKSLVATDFTCTVNGTARVISSASWAGNAITLVLASAADYADVVVVTFVKTGQTRSVTNNVFYPLILKDGNTVAMYVYDDPAVVIKDGANRVSEWKNKIGIAGSLLQATGERQPLYSENGILFDGANDTLQAAAFAFVQPEFIYLVMRHVTHGVAKYFFDGNTGASGIVTQDGVSPNIKYYAGALSGNNSQLVVGNYSIVRVLFHGANSKLQINKTAALAANVGSLNMGGFTLGGRPSNGGNWSNIEVKEVILRKSADDDATQAVIYDYLETKHGIV